jgi:hypothetical protein
MARHGPGTRVEEIWEKFIIHHDESWTRCSRLEAAMSEDDLGGLRSQTASCAAAKSILRGLGGNDILHVVEFKPPGQLWLSYGSPRWGALVRNRVFQELSCGRGVMNSRDIAA